MNYMSLSQFLVLVRGNQTEAARLLHINRGTLRKYIANPDCVIGDLGPGYEDGERYRFFTLLSKE